MLAPLEISQSTKVTIHSMERDELQVTPLPVDRFDELFDLQRHLAGVKNPAYAAFGEDEFIGIDGFRALIDSGDTLIAIDGKKDDVINSFACVAPSVFVKYYKAAIADLFVGVSSAQAEAGMFRKWIDIAIAHARKLGYVTVLVQTFVTNVVTFSDLREAGFEYCAQLPSSGRIIGVGLTDSVLWRKTIADRSVSSSSKLLSMLPPHVISTAENNFLLTLYTRDSPLRHVTLYSIETYTLPPR